MENKNECENGDFDTLEVLTQKPYALEYNGKDLASVELRDWLVKEDLSKKLLRWFVHNEKDLDILIGTEQTWLDDTAMVRRLLKQGNNLQLIAGCIENGKFVPVSKTEYVNIDRLKRD